MNNLRKFLWKNVKVIVGDEHPKQLVKWVRASLRNQIFRINGKMSLESSHLTHAEAEQPQLTRAPRTPT